MEKDKVNLSFGEGDMKQRKSKFMIMTMAFLLCSCGSDLPDLRAIKINNSTAKKFKDQSLDESQRGYLEAMKQEPFQEEIHLNLGSVYEALKDPEKALRLYKNVEQLYAEKKPLFTNKYLQFLNPPHSPLLLFFSYFNQAQLLARDNKIDEALEKYQQALLIVPDSKEVKTNIELLIQQKQKQEGGVGDSQNKDPKDQKDQKQQGKGDNSNDKNKDQKNSDGDKEDQKKDYSSSPKYKPREFKGELNRESIKKIFGEISQQEKKMRAQFSKKNQTKEAPRDKDW